MSSKPEINFADFADFNHIKNLGLVINLQSSGFLRGNVFILWTSRGKRRLSFAFLTSHCVNETRSELESGRFWLYCHFSFQLNS